MLRLTLALVFCLPTVLTFNPTTVLAEKNCAKLITERCETCHYKTRICQKLGKKSRGQWKRSVKNMVHYGAVLNKDEIKTLVACLYSQDKSIVSLCEKDE